MDKAELLSFEQIDKIEEKYAESTFVPYLYKILKLKAQQNLTLGEMDSLNSAISKCQNFLEKIEGFMGVTHTEIFVYLLKIQLDQLHKKP